MLPTSPSASPIVSSRSASRFCPAPASSIWFVHSSSSCPHVHIDRRSLPDLQAGLPSRARTRRATGSPTDPHIPRLTSSSLFVSSRLVFSFLPRVTVKTTHGLPTRAPTPHVTELESLSGGVPPYQGSYLSGDQTCRVKHLSDTRQNGKQAFQARLDDSVIVTTTRSRRSFKSCSRSPCMAGKLPKTSALPIRGHRMATRCVQGYHEGTPDFLPSLSFLLLPTTSNLLPTSPCYLLQICSPRYPPSKPSSTQHWTSIPNALDRISATTHNLKTHALMRCMIHQTRPCKWPQVRALVVGVSVDHDISSAGLRAVLSVVNSDIGDRQLPELELSVGFNMRSGQSDVISAVLNSLHLNCCDAYSRFF